MEGSFPQNELPGKLSGSLVFLAWFQSPQCHSGHILWVICSTSPHSPEVSWPPHPVATGTLPRAVWVGSRSRSWLSVGTTVSCSGNPALFRPVEGTAWTMRPAGCHISTSCFPRKLWGAAFILCTLVMGVPAFPTPSAESTGATGNCSFRGKYFKEELRLEGEPVVLRCPLLRSYLEDSANPQHLVTWHENSSAQLIPVGEPRVQTKDDALWILPAVRGDSGMYICRLREASHCEEIAIELKIFEDAEAVLSLISYPQTLTLGADGMLMCPDTQDFSQDKGGMGVWWYKGPVLLGGAGGRFHNVEEKRRLLIVNVSMEDAGYYRCVLAFVHEGRQFNVTRHVRLRLHKQTDTVPVIISPLDTISASLGSRLTIPCKVSLGTSTPLTTSLWWIANFTQIDSAYPGGRVTEGPRGEYSANGENFVEVPLNFDPVIREDLSTDFRCIVSNTLGFQTLRTTVKEEG
ncbi:PREDICTED: interleukin-1 receptor type 2 isoform X2 [Chinchilla lanigera]|uniref:interleukin-1 receptor type 2 isoform X2 n=1 Tax=Chinchilla lanigera TaxID=34839 RepID=UPI000696064B|nr:PREDICTED: interleukin-1 receptor type 2 isoform X2 [Chinchilla lanigera]